MWTLKNLSLQPLNVYLRVTEFVRELPESKHTIVDSSPRFTNLGPHVLMKRDWHITTWTRKWIASWNPCYIFAIMVLTDPPEKFRIFTPWEGPTKACTRGYAASSTVLVAAGQYCCTTASQLNNHEVEWKQNNNICFTNDEPCQINRHQHLYIMMCI